MASWARFGPYLVASVLLLLGYLRYAPGAAYSLSAEHYRAWAFPAFRYSDLIWLYLRDGLDRQPVPYIDFALEYPPLTGFLTWLFSWAPDLPTYFTLVYLILTACALLTVWALQRLGGANAWLFAASPALFFYTGHQWDMAAIAAAAVGLLAFQRGRDGWGVVGLVIATSLKLFPVVFVAAAVVERLRDRRFRSAAGLALAFAAGTAIINIPVALASFEGWSFFFRWNRDRLADSGIWVLWRGTPTEDLTRWSFVAALAGGLALTILAFRARGPLTIPLGATYLLWWLLVNKTFTTHLMLWAILSLALLSAPWWLWALTTGVDLVGFQLGNFLNLYNIPDYRHAPLIQRAVENIYDPLQLARSVILLACTSWGGRILSHERSRIEYAASGRRNLHPIAPLREFTCRPGTIPCRAQVLRGAGILALFTLATVAMTWPYARQLRDATVAGFDPYLQIWLSEWIQHALRTDPPRLYDANIFHPFTRTLAYTDANIPGALVAAPLRALTGDPILTNSLLVLATFVLAASGVYALVVHLTDNRGAGIVAGLAYAFLPYRMVHLWHLNWLEGGVLPWLLLALLRMLERPTVARGVVVGLLSGMLVLISFYFSVQLLILAVVLVVSWSIARRRLPNQALWRAVGVALLVLAVVAMPPYLPYLKVREDQRLERTIVDAEQYKAVPASYVQLAPWDQPNLLQQAIGVRAGTNESLTEVGQARHADGHQHLEIVIEDALYPGTFAALFAVAGVVWWRSHRWLVVALIAVGAIAALLSLGPSFGPRHEDGPSLPYGWLFDHAPFFRAMRVPARLGGLVGLAVVLLAGLGIAAVWRGIGNHAHSSSRARHTLAGPLLTATLAGLVLLDLWTGSVPLEAVDRAPEAGAAATWLAGQPHGAVMVFPAESVFADPAAASVRRHYGETMFWSTRHWKPLVNGNSGFIPRAYSDFIERFVGQILRPDGTVTPRISHLDAATTRLLGQIGVRYVVFERAKYRNEDWPAVEAELASLVESGLLQPEGDHGGATIFIVNPTTPPIASSRVRLFAPTLLTPGSAWAPWVGVESPEGTPSVLALTRPSRLRTTWYDDEGRALRSSEQLLPLPAVLDEPRLLCDAIECLTSRPFDDLAQLPPPGPGGWSPGAPGHYIVRLQLMGDQSIDCRVDLDIVADMAEVRRRSADNPWRWAECADWSPHPINDPGALPLVLSAPSVTFVGDVANVDIAVTPRIDGELRGWFILSPPGVAEPWLEAVYQSSVQQKLLRAREPSWFAWSEPAGAEIEPGVYELTVWFHRQGETDWEHAAGGDIGLAPVVVDDAQTLRWAGPVRGQLARQPAPFPRGATAQVELSVTGATDRVRCEADWRILAGREVIVSGHSGDCASPEIAIPASVPPGQYRLHVDLYASEDDERQLSDAVSMPVTVLANAADGAPS